MQISEGARGEGGSWRYNCTFARDDTLDRYAPRKLLLEKQEKFHLEVIARGILFVPTF